MKGTPCPNAETAFLFEFVLQMSLYGWIREGPLPPLLSASDFPSYFSNTSVLRLKLILPTLTVIFSKVAGALK